MIPIDIQFQVIRSNGKVNGQAFAHIGKAQDKCFTNILLMLSDHDKDEMENTVPWFNLYSPYLYQLHHLFQTSFQTGFVGVACPWPTFHVLVITVIC